MLPGAVPIVLLTWCGGLWGEVALGPPVADEAPAEAAPAPEATPTIAAQNSTFRRIRSWADEQLQSLYDNLIVDAQDLHQFGLRPRPHARDLISLDYWRLDVRLFYGFNRRYEGELEFGNYFPSPGRGAHGAGIAHVRVNLRYRWTPNLDPTGKATVGVEMLHPYRSAPLGLTEGVNRYMVYATYARVSTRFRDTQEFVNLACTVLTPAAAVGGIAFDRPQDDFVSLGIGLVHNEGPITCALSASWDHVITSRPADYLSVTPSVMWDVPVRYTRWTPGSWQVGTALTVKRIQDKTDVAVRLRLRWLVKLRDIWRRRAGTVP